MSDLILHHYSTSPFSEKIRAVLGYKQLAWKSVFTPSIMPKPDLTALTGGYRKAPVLQIGADIYCDSKRIVRALDSLSPQRPLVPRGQEAVCAAMEQWTEQVLFFLVIPIVFQPQGMAHFFGKLAPAAVAGFQKDREALFAGGTAKRPSKTATHNELPAFLSHVDAQLAAAPFLLGPAPTVADFSVYHLIWFIHSNPGVRAYLDPY
ncbi:MAG: glutathione S-transferase family protein, partial [Stenotrophobium sp.]